MARLTKIQKVYIEAQMEKESLSKIASTLGIKIADVEKHIEKLREEIAATAEEAKETPEPETPPQPQTPKASDMMIKRRGIAIMTREASELGDESRRVSGKPTSRHADSIFKINPEKETM